MDPMIQEMNKKTRTPAKMVRSGGPGTTSLDFISSDFSGGFVFDADTRLLHLFFACSFSSFFNLKGNHRTTMGLDIKESPICRRAVHQY